MERITVHEMVELVTGSAEKKWLLIGATREGRGLYCELKRRNEENSISMWTDKKYNFYRICGLPMDDPENIYAKSFCGIILSSDFVCKYFEALSSLYLLNGFPVYIMYGDTDDLPDFQWNNPKYTDMPINQNELIHISPLRFVNEKRLDIVIRYIACKEIMAGTESDGLEMYKKLTLSMNAGEEYVHPFTTCSYFSAYAEKKGICNFIKDWSALIKSMQKNGFSAKHYVPLSPSYGVINGAHRIATALALGINVYAKIFVGFGEPFLSFDKNDLKRIGYTDMQISLIEKTYKKIMNKEF